MPLTGKPPLSRWLAQAAIVACAALGTAAYAQCPEQHELVGDQLFNQNGAAYISRRDLLKPVWIGQKHGM